MNAKKKKMLARSKEGREAALQREKAGCDRRVGQSQLRKALEELGPSFWALWLEGSNYGEGCRDVWVCWRPVRKMAFPERQRLGRRADWGLEEVRSTAEDTSRLRCPK